MSIAVAIPNHNQHRTVLKTIDMLMSQTVRPAAIFVLSDAKPFYSGNPLVVHIVNREKTGRCDNRNSVVRPFLESGADCLVFMDGDCCPKERDYLERYEALLTKHGLVFGTREHTEVKHGRIALPASDLLTANMDNMWAGKPLDYTDLRVASGAVSAWQTAKTFNERLDLMLTGMIGWSCNFGFSRTGLDSLAKFVGRRYGVADGIFDSGAFTDGWGYEDVAMGIDAMYAGLDIWIDTSVPVMHRSHERSDGLFDHVKGRHVIMERYRDIEKSMRGRNLVLYSAIVASAFFTGGLITGLVTMSINLHAILGF